MYYATVNEGVDDDDDVQISSVKIITQNGFGFKKEISHDLRDSSAIYT